MLGRHQISINISDKTFYKRGQMKTKDYGKNRRWGKALQIYACFI